MVCYRSTNQGLGIWPFESYIWLYLPLNVRHLIFCLTFSLITCYRTDLINTVLLEMGFVWLNLYCSLTVSLELSGSVSAWWYWDTKMAVVIHQGLSVRHFIPFIVSSYIIKKLDERVDPTQLNDLVWCLPLSSAASSATLPFIRKMSASPHR